MTTIPKAVVIDNGSFIYKAGISTERSPILKMRTVVGISKDGK